MSAFSSIIIHDCSGTASQATAQGSRRANTRACACRPPAMLRAALLSARRKAGLGVGASAMPPRCAGGGGAASLCCLRNRPPRSRQWLNELLTDVVAKLANETELVSSVVSSNPAASLPFKVPLRRGQVLGVPAPGQHDQGPSRRHRTHGLHGRPAHPPDRRHGPQVAVAPSSSRRDCLFLQRGVLDHRLQTLEEDRSAHANSGLVLCINTFIHERNYRPSFCEWPQRQVDLARTHARTRSLTAATTPRAWSPRTLPSPPSCPRSCFITGKRGSGNGQ